MSERKSSRISNRQIPCIVKSCPHLCDSGVKHNKKFLYFPKDPDISMDWISAIDREDLLKEGFDYIHYNFRICTKHFPLDMFKNESLNELKPDAKPSVEYFKHKDVESENEELLVPISTVKRSKDSNSPEAPKKKKKKKSNLKKKNSFKKRKSKTPGFSPTQVIVVDDDDDDDDDHHHQNHDDDNDKGEVDFLLTNDDNKDKDDDDDNDNNNDNEAEGSTDPRNLLFLSLQ